MKTQHINQREADRLVRAYTARVMAEHFAKMTTLDLVLEGRRGKRDEITLEEMRSFIRAFDAETDKLERRAGNDDETKKSTPAAAPGAEVQP